MGRTQKEDRERGVDEEDIFHRVIFFLAAITRFLFGRVLGADDAAFGPVMGKRGDTGGGGVRPGCLPPPAARPQSPRRLPRPRAAVPGQLRERAGASPRVRSAASSAGKST